MDHLMMDRGRQRTGPVIGSGNGNAKLNEEAILRIRRMISQGATNVAIAPAMGVTHQMISKIRRGHFWRHVPNEKGEAS